ncbi:MAG: phosphoribosylanthranilate isomerase [Elusimicrobiota bacterium]|jgi:phosphoribosylanthranilate isomerase
MIKVKICGITNSQDALWAANLGVDYIGLNFYPQSPRKVSLKYAKEMAAQIPPFVTVVGLFVDEPLESLTKFVQKVPLKVVQLHGQETPEYCRSVKALGVKIIKALAIEKPLEAAELSPYEGVADFFLFDHKTPEMPGGTGEAFNWEWLQNASFLTKPWFLAGGLNADNIAQAIKQLHPPAVDVCSGVERTPTRKDYEAMKRFIQTARAAK